MSVTYLNMRGSCGRETVDELDPSDFETRAAFRAERDRLCSEYAMCGMAVYPSTRPCANWKD